MLINYTFSNFRSFKNSSELSMKAGRQSTLSENLIRHNKMRILPSTVIYGGNASGKSNIIMSLAIMKDIVVSGTADMSNPNLRNMELYPFAYQDEEKPMRFEIDFYRDKLRAVFGFEILVGTFKRDERKIISECLSIIDKTDKKIKIYSRINNKVTLNKDKKALAIIDFDEKLLKQFEKKMNENLDDSELFLSRGFKSSISNELADFVIDFFKEDLVVVSDFTLKKANLTLSIDNEPEKDYFIWNKILDVFVKNADFGPQSIMFKPSKSDDKESQRMELVSVYHHNSESHMIPAELMESRGTLKLLDFAISFEKLFKRGGVMMLDEFDAAIHPELIKGILALFNDREMNKEGAQLIFTTHNPIYLNNKIFRRDQIRFVEKDVDTFESVIFSLSDFGSEEVRNDHNYLINYFKGNYGALPYIDFVKLLRNKEESEDEI